MSAAYSGSGGQLVGAHVKYRSQRSLRQLRFEGSSGIWMPLVPWIQWKQIYLGGSLLPNLKGCTSHYHHLRSTVQYLKPQYQAPLRMCPRHPHILQDHRLRVVRLFNGRGSVLYGAIKPVSLLCQSTASLGRKQRGRAISRSKM